MRPWSPNSLQEHISTDLKSFQEAPPLKGSAISQSYHRQRTKPLTHGLWETLIQTIARLQLFQNIKVVLTQTKKHNYFLLTFFSYHLLLYYL
jgi:hypothetical protein